VENENKLKLVGLSHEGKAPIKPSPETIENGSYVLARPLLIYVSLNAAQRPEVQSFVEFYLKNAGNLAKEVGYVPLPEKRYEQALADFQKAVKEFKQAH
jgi:phosphate transport system substrate-binding protein